MKAKGKMGALGLVGGGLFTGVDFVSNVSAGDDLVTAGVKTAATTMLWAAAPWTMGIATTASMIPDMAEAGTQWYKGKTDWWQQQFSRGHVGGGYQDSQRALTMRQAAVQQIQGSKLNARSALGGEARIFADNYHRT